MKRCPNCGWLNVSEFYKFGGGPCRSCAKSRSRATYRASAGIPMDSPNLRGKANSSSIGTVSSRNGYSIVKVGQDKSCHHRADKTGWVLEHIIEAEKKYGFPITREYTVHHRNGDRTDNRPDNLELRVGLHGKGADALDGLLRCPENRERAAELLRSYGYVVTA